MARGQRLIKHIGLLVPILTGTVLAIAVTLGRASHGTPSEAATACGTVTRRPNHAYLPVVVGEGEAATPLPTPTSGLKGRPSWGGPIARSPVDGTVWAVNPDSGSVTAMDGGRLEKVVEVPVGREPWSLAIAPDGRAVYIVDRAAGTLVVVDAHNYGVRATLPVGPEPGAVALNPTGSRAYVTVTAADAVAVVDTGRLELSACIPVSPKPYAVAVTDDGDAVDADEQVAVTHLLALPRPGGSEAADDGREGRVTVIDAGTHAVVRQIRLAPDDHGFPNLLAGIALAGKRAWVPVVRASPALPNGLTTTAFAAVAALDLDAGSENPSAHLPLNDQEIFGSPVNNPVAAIPAPDGERLYTVLAGSDLVEVIDVSDPGQPRLVKFLEAGSNPRGLALSQDGRRGYVMSYLSRAVTVLDLENLEVITEVPVTGETLQEQVLRGKILFHNASNPKLSQGSWLSCASCHPDGGSDGVTWRFPDGPRQTPALWYAGPTLPWHWSAALDEAQDVEETIQVIQHGLGLAPGIDPPRLGKPHAGRSADLDALAAFLQEGIRAPALPTSGDVATGRGLFEAAGCVACHGGATWTTSALPGAPGTLDPDGNGMVDDVLREVGTLNPEDVRGETGFDPPSLLHVRLTAPYLHDGSMPTLEALLASGHPDPNGSGNGLDAEGIAALAGFLRAIGPDTMPFGQDQDGR